MSGVFTAFTAHKVTTTTAAIISSTFLPTAVCFAGVFLTNLVASILGACVEAEKIKPETALKATYALTAISI